MLFFDVLAGDGSEAGIYRLASLRIKVDVDQFSALGIRVCIVMLPGDGIHICFNSLPSDRIEIGITRGISIGIHERIAQPIANNAQVLQRIPRIADDITVHDPAAFGGSPPSSIEFDCSHFLMPSLRPMLQCCSIHFCRSLHQCSGSCSSPEQERFRPRGMLLAMPSLLQMQSSY